MRILVTRPQPAADRTAALLREHGIDPLVVPLMAIRPLTDALPDLSDYQALAFTSANAVRVYAQLGGRGGGKALAVGDATAAAAREAGFADVTSAEGDGAALAELIARTLDPAKGPLAHLRGKDVAGDVIAGLADSGFTVDPLILYRAETADSLPREALSAFRTRTLDGVALYSPRSVRTLMELVLKAGLGDACRRLTAYCLSEAVAATLERPGLAVPWRRIAVAASPTEAGLIGLIDPAAEPSPPPRSPTMTAPILSNAEAIIAAFGGIRPMAKKLGVAVTTVQGWKERGSIPVGRFDQIRDAAAREGIDLEAAAEAGGSAGGDAPEAAAASPEPARTESPTDEAPKQGGPWQSAGKPAGAQAEPAARARAERVEPAPEAGVKPAPDRTPPPSIEHPARERGGGWTRPFAFGAGVAIVLAVGIFLGWFLGPERPGTASLDVQKRHEAALKDATGKIGDLEKRLAAARKENAVLGGRLAEVEKKAAAPGADNAAVSKQFADLQAKLDKATGVIASAQAALRDRLAKLEGDVSKLPAAGDQEAVTRVREATEALQKKLAAIEADIGKLGGGEAVKETNEKVAALDKTAAALKARLDAAQAARQALARQVAALAARLDEAAGSRSAALVAAIGQVRSQALSGRPFAPELETASGLAKGQPVVAGLLDQLSAHAKAGVPTVEALATEFRPLATEIVRAARSAEAGDWFDRAWARVRSSVVIRRTGENVKGDAPEALVARAEAALNKGALADAVRLVAALPEGARKPAGAWLAKARARLAVEAASAALGRQAVKLAAGQAAAPPGDAKK